MRAAALAVLCQLLWLAPAGAQQASNTQPGTNAPLLGCVEGRALRIVNGLPSCAQTAAPTLSGCGAGTIDGSATDFIGQVSLPAGLTTCTVVMTQLYPTTFICFVSPQTAGLSLTLAGAVSGNNGSRSTLTVPFALTLAATKFGYLCGPG